MTILATGTTGTIGRHLPISVKSFEIDLAAISSPNSFSRIGTRDDFLHLAGIVGTNEVEKDKKHSNSVNVNGAALLAEEFLNRSKGRFYFISTSHVYAPSVELIGENAKTEPSSLYAEQKLKAELKISEIFANSPERLCVIRIFSVLDWDVAPFTLGGAVKKLIEPNSSFELRNSDDLRDFMTPKNIAAALFEIANSGKLDGIVNLCTGVGTKVRDAVTRMMEESGYVIPKDRIKPGNSENPIVVGDNTRLMRSLPNLNLEWRPTAHI